MFKTLKDNFKIFSYIKYIDRMTIHRFINYSHIYESIIDFYIDFRYEIKKPFKKGGYGNIFLAFDNKEKREVVIKKIDISLINEEKFNREINSMKEVNCQYSVEIYDYYWDKNYYYIVMEKCDENLFDYLQKNEGMSESKIKEILLELNVAFKKMYLKNIIHRDLKPENIFIKYNKNNKDFIVKLGDFGLSREYKQKKFSTLKGTYLYMAPEIEKAYINKSNYDPNKCDLWAIGLIIYYLRFKDIPIYAFILGNIPTKFDDNNINDLLKKLIVIDPDKRISWEDYFNHPLFN